MGLLVHSSARCAWLNIADKQVRIFCLYSFVIRLPLKAQIA
jgi:hypothetical protein